MKLKRILALAGALLLLAMYSCTLIFAFADSPASRDLLKASVVCTVVLPMLLYGYALIYRVSRSSSDADAPECNDTEEQ